MGARSGGGSGRMSSKVLYGAAARNELRGMNANDFFHYGLTHNEYQKYTKDENARRGNPVVFGNKGLEVGHMAHSSYSVNGRIYSDTGRITKIEGDHVWMEVKGGYPKYVPKSSIKHYAKDKKMDYGSFHMKVQGNKPMVIKLNSTPK